jgi:eukaryotic-like serine/threonine-protein kinase
LLWRGDTADEAKKFRKRYKGPLSDVERAFLDEVISYEVALQRRRRTAVIAGFAGLSVLVIGAMIALVVIQRSRQEATHQAKVAEQALKDRETKEHERQTADAEKQKAESEKQQAQTEVVEVKHESEEELRKKNTELSAALDESRKNEDLAKSAAQLAQESADRAQKSQAEAEDRRNEVVQKEKTIEDLFRREQERRKQLEQQIGSPIVDELK